LKEGFGEKGAKAISEMDSHFNIPSFYNLHWQNSETAIKVQKWVPLKSLERNITLRLESKNRKLVMPDRMPCTMYDLLVKVWP